MRVASILDVTDDTVSTGGEGIAVGFLLGAC
jgi:hypothetical protein